MELTYWWLPPIAISTLLLGVLLYSKIRLKRKRKKPNKYTRVLLIANSSRVYKNPIYRQALSSMKLGLIAGIFLLIIAFLAILFLVARPVQKTVEKPVNRNRDIVLCLDTSGSMSSANSQVSKEFGRLALSLKGERIGLVAFDNTPITVFPLTDDYDFIEEQLNYFEKAFSARSSPDTGADSVDTDFSLFRALAGTTNGEGSSVIGDGLAGCISAFDKMDSKRSRSIVFVTDNRLAGDYIITILEAGALAKAKDIRVYGINPSDYTYKRFDGSINYPDEVAEFRQLTISTGGSYYVLNEETTMPSIVSHIQAQETARVEGSPQVIYSDKPELFILISAVVLIVLYVISWRLRL